jgi:hypothetical protein
MSNNKKGILGFFVLGQPSLYSDSEEIKKLAKKNGKIFRSYLWGENGIDSVLEKLKHENYGKDIELILFEFYINPFEDIIHSLKEIENYRKKEKSIGIPILITDDVFFKLSDKNRYEFLKNSILDKLNLLANTVIQKKLDTKINILISDLQKTVLPDGSDMSKPQQC